MGLKRRTGVAAPLFSLYSEESVGIGELRDLKRLIDWCSQAGMSLLQLLPMNDAGFHFTPYDAESAFALDPMYLALDQLVGVKVEIFRKDITSLKKKFPTGKRRVNYGVKTAKLQLLWKMYRISLKKSTVPFRRFTETQASWLEGYALFKVVKEITQGKAWWEWPEEIKTRHPKALIRLKKDHRDAAQFQKWLQWQLFQQFLKVKAYAKKKKVWLMGDLPFLVSRDSADVWTHQDYFKLHLLSGAPPDLYFAQGQRWGMPPYDWEKMAAQGYDWLIEKLKYAEHFYDLFRIDHVVGIFRVWTIRKDEPAETCGLNGVFDPPEEARWEEQGRKILSLMIRSTRMLPCAEDLGIIPKCSYRVLEELGIPGMEVQRWTKDWGKTNDFKGSSGYRENSLTVISTHDMMPFCAWWEYEAGTVDAVLFRRKCSEKGIPFEVIQDELFDFSKSSHGRLRWRDEIDNETIFLGVLKRLREEVWELAELYQGSFGEKEKFWNYAGLSGPFSEKPTNELIRGALMRAARTNSIFHIQLLQDWLALAGYGVKNAAQYRINFPGTSDEKNWSVVLPLSLEKLNQLKLAGEIRKILKAGDSL